MKPKEEMSNYEKWCEQWRIKFLELDQIALMKRLPELRDEGEWLTLFHFGRKFGVNRIDGQIIAMEDQKPVSCYEKLNIYTLFGYVSPCARIMGKWVRFDQLKNAAPFSKAFQEGIIMPFGRTFNGYKEQLEQTFCKLQGYKIPQSDVGYELNAFSCMPVKFLFWEGDDEFQAQGNLLFDASATDFIHVESIVTIAAVGLEKLAKEAGVTLDRSAFPVF